jgi:hypothetical protein
MHDGQLDIHKYLYHRASSKDSNGHSLSPSRNLNAMGSSSYFQASRDGDRMVSSDAEA